jgi:hypothetical protein
VKSLPDDDDDGRKPTTVAHPTNNGRQNTTQKIKDWATWIPLKTGDENQIDKQFLLL